MSDVYVEKPPTRKTVPKVNSVVYALKTLKLMASSNRPLGVTEIAREIEINLSSCFNILKTLVAEGFLIFDSKSKKYSLGSGALELSEKTGDATRRFQDVHPTLMRLANKHTMTLGFWEVREPRLFLAGLVESAAAVRIQMSTGQRLPLGSGALGRVIAVSKGIRGEALVKHIESAKWYKAPNIRAYTRELAQVANQHWASDIGQFLAGIITVACVIESAPHEPRYCIALSSFMGQLEEDSISTVGDDLHKAALAIQESWYGRD